MFTLIKTFTNVFTLSCITFLTICYFYFNAFIVRQQGTECNTHLAILSVCLSLTRWYCELLQRLTDHQAIKAEALPTTLPETDREVLFAVTIMMVRHDGYSDDDDDDDDDEST